MNNGLSYIIYHLPNKTNSIQNGFFKIYKSVKQKYLLTAKHMSGNS